MTSLQFAVGALNDIVDAPADAGRAMKPIPSGTVSVTLARVVVALSAAIGLALAATVAPQVVAVALVVLTVGAAYVLFA